MTERELRVRDILGEDKVRGKLAVLFEELPPEPDRRKNFLNDFLNDKDLNSILGEKTAMLFEKFRDFPTDSFKTDKDFIFAVSEVVMDYFDQNLDPMETEKILREKFIETGKFIPLNEILSYGYYKEAVHIHLASAKTIDKEERGRIINEGLQKLARKLKEDPELKDVKKITATSWIVFKMPEFLEAMGFTIDGPIDEEKRQKYFAHEKGEIWAAHIDREDFLKKYLN